jgi:hypothetical protein
LIEEAERKRRFISIRLVDAEAWWNRTAGYEAQPAFLARTFRRKSQPLANLRAPAGLL